LLGPNVHQQIFPCSVVTIQSLQEVLHGGGKLSVGATDLFEQHIAEPRIRRVDTHRIQELFHVVVHRESSPTQPPQLQPRTEHIPCLSSPANGTSFHRNAIEKTRV